MIQQFSVTFQARCAFSLLLCPQALQGQVVGYQFLYGQALLCRVFTLAQAFLGGIGGR